MTRRRIAIIGLGKIAQDQHLPVADKSPDYEIVAVSSTRGLGHRDVPTFRTPADMYRAVPDIEAVVICTPPEVRHAIAIEAIEAGKDVMLEKPPAATVTEFEDLVRRAKAAGRVLFATWHSQFNPAVEEARALLAAGGLRALRIEWREDVRKWHPGQDWVFEPGGFGVFDPGINALSIFVHILPGTAFVRSAELTYPANRQTPIAARLVFSSDVAGKPELTADFDWREQGDEKWHMMIETADGRSARLFEGGASLSIDGKTVVAAPREEYERIYERFTALLDERRSDVDGAPLRLVADAMLVGTRLATAPFEW
ncbi:MAG: Gfo/Idh/MocA family oxidoreductase [Rhizobiales bacterium]|nr:Gfo/Idh/MocA family oxidoreductase [Hyphomicrobiales bacterium]